MHLIHPGPCQSTYSIPNDKATWETLGLSMSPLQIRFVKSDRLLAKFNFIVEVDSTFGTGLRLDFPVLSEAVAHAKLAGLGK